MTTLCRLLHLQDILEQERDADQLLDLAVLADKYNCCGSIRGVTHVWLDRAITQANDNETRARLLVAAYWLGLKGPLSTVGVDIVMKSEGPFSLDAAGESAEPLGIVAGKL